VIVNWPEYFERQRARNRAESARAEGRTIVSSELPELVRRAAQGDREALQTLGNDIVRQMEESDTPELRAAYLRGRIADVDGRAWYEAMSLRELRWRHFVQAFRGGGCE
jgi:hypothetical protein